MNNMAQESVAIPVQQDQDTVTDEDIQRKPWKFVGYKGYAAFCSSDNDFMVLRRFGDLNFRIALKLQNKVSELEEELSRLESQHMRKSAELHNNGSLRGDTCADRPSLLDKIEVALKQYNDFLLQQAQLRKLPNAPRHDIRNIKTWHMNKGYRAIDEAEQRYLDHEDDLVCVAAMDKNPIRRLIDSSKLLRRLRIWEEKRNNTPSYDISSVIYHSETRINDFASAVICIIGMILLVAPIWGLQSIEALVPKLAVIMSSVLVFLLVVSFGMDTRPFEAFGATAAYAAVLMAFLDLGP